MYSFTSNRIGRFTVYQSVQRAGDTHLKKFKAGVTPQNQETINIYVAGSFRFSVGEFTQDLPAGSTTLDLEIEAFPEGIVAAEEVLSSLGIRYCVSPDNGAYTKQIVNISNLTPFEASVKSVAFVLTGSVTVAGVVLGQGAYASLGQGSQVSGNGRLLILT